MSVNTVKVKKYVDIVEEYTMLTGQAVMPGMLVDVDSDSKLIKHAGDGGKALPMFALEDELQGKTIDDAYGDEQPVQVWIPQRGEVVYAMLADTESVDPSDFLVSAGNGYLKAWTSETVDGAIVAKALETVDMGASEGVWPATGRRIKVRIV